MVTFNLTLGAPSLSRLTGLAGTKYSAAPRTNPFEATVNGTKSPAWTTMGRDSHYVYFKDGDQLYYVKVPGPEELTSARQALVITSDEWEEQQPTAPVRIKRGRPAKPKAQATP